MARWTREELQAPVSMWREDDMIGGERTDAFVLILRTTGCRWSYRGGCLMCGYNASSSAAVTADDLRAQLAKALERYRGERMVKLYTSGSFLDEREVPPDLRDEVFSAFDKADRLLFESRPEFITEGSLSCIDPARSSVAIGLESSNDEVLLHSVRKGFTAADYSRAAELLRDHKVPLRTYLLLKPPYLTERRAVEDAVSSIQYSSRFSESVSVNPVNVQKGTVVEALWRRGNYRPPWLWSLVEVLRQGKEIGQCRVMSSPSGGGTVRGAHNCDRCDRKVLDAIQRFSFTQDAGGFEELECGCRKEWAAVMDVQDTMGTSVDISRYLSSELELD